MSIFTMRFNELRKDSKKTQAQVAADLGMKPQAISYIAKGREPDFETVIKIADYFNVTTDYLLGKSNFPNDSRYEEALKQAEDISRMLPDLNPKVRDEFLSVLGELLRVGGAAIPKSSDALFRRLTAIIGCLVNIKIAYSGGVAQWAQLERREGVPPRELELEQGAIPAKFKALLADACTEGRAEFDRLYHDLDSMFEHDCMAEDKKARMMRVGDTEPRRSGKEAPVDGDGN